MTSTKTARRFVIIGNGVAGTTAAETIRKEDPNASIVIIANEPHPLYNRVSLPPYLKGAVTLKKVMMRDEQAHRDKGIDLRLNTRATRVDTQAKEVYTDDGKVLPYDRLLVATGGRPNLLDVPGSEAADLVYVFQTLDDTEDIIRRMGESESAVVVGGSFIAYELAEGFQQRGLKTHWMIRGPYFLRRVLDASGGALVDAIARRHGVAMMYGDEVSRIEPGANERSHQVVSTGEQRVEAQIVGVGLGLKLNTEILDGTGITVNKGIVTDEYLRTSDPDVFAAGDVAEFREVHLGRHITMGTWNNAVSHGKIAGTNMLGGSKPYDTVPTYTSGLFHSKLAVMGATPEIHPDLTAYASVNMEEETYSRVFFLGDVLVGAVLIGNVRNRRMLLELIKSREPVERPAELVASAL